MGNELSACCGAPSDEEDDALAYPAEWKREVVAREGEAAGIRPQARTSMDAGTAAIEGIPPDYRPRAAANQGEWGECTIFAFTEVVQDHLEVRFNTSLDERDTRSALTRPCNAFDGVWPEAVGAKINELGAGLKLKAKSPRPELYQLQIAGAKVTDFDTLCADAEAKAGAGAFSVVVIRTDHTPPDNLHSVAAHTLIQEATGPLILAKNSWGGNVPRYKVSRANYDSHYTFDVKIVGCWKPSGDQQPAPVEAEAYRSILRGNRDRRAQLQDFSAQLDQMGTQLEAMRLRMEAAGGPAGRDTGGGLVPAGMIAQWAGDVSAIPEGWVRCDSPRLRAARRSVAEAETSVAAREAEASGPDALRRTRRAQSSTKRYPSPLMAAHTRLRAAQERVAEQCALVFIIRQ